MLKNKHIPPGRPRKCRCVRQEPKIRYFKPQGVPSSLLQEIDLTIDECEALCFADRQGLYQVEAAKKMKISRSTFCNIIESARKKVAEAILCGKAIRIGGGTYRLAKAKSIQQKQH